MPVDKRKKTAGEMKSVVTALRSVMAGAVLACWGKRTFAPWMWGILILLHSTRL
jgi:hypothetical protein